MANLTPSFRKFSSFLRHILFYEKAITYWKLLSNQNKDESATKESSDLKDSIGRIDGVLSPPDGTKVDNSSHIQ